MSKGKRYDSEPKLNMKKVFAVIIAFVVIIMFIVIIKGLLKNDNSNGKIVSKNYFTSFKDNKWGVIDSNGNSVIDPSYKEMIVIPNNKIAVFICTYDINYETGEYKTKVLNDKNLEILTEYDKVETLQNMDENNNLIYDKNALKVMKNGKYGLIDFSGKQLTSIEFDEITTIPLIENAFKVKKDNKYGIIDSNGKIVVEPKYADIDILGKDNKSGFIVKDDTGKAGIIDYSGIGVIDIKYDSIQKVYGNDLYTVVLNGKEKLVNKKDEEVLASGFDSVKEILNSQENAIIFEKNQKYGIMSLNGEILLDTKYDYLKEAKSGIFIAKLNEKYGLIDIKGDIKLEIEYVSVIYNEKIDAYIVENSEFNTKILNGNMETKLEGLLLELNIDKGYFKFKVDEEYKYYNFKFEEKSEKDIFPNRTLFLIKKDGKYGYVDKNGNTVVDCIYDDAQEQNDYGYEAVKKDGKWGSLDSNGKIVQEPIYNLDNYLVINFIGRWHMGSDININYYNQL